MAGIPTYGEITQPQQSALAALAALPKGSFIVGTSTVPGPITPGNDGDLLEFDATEPTGMAKVTAQTLFARRAAWYGASSLVIDCANGVNQRIFLTNGVNALTAFSNAVNGETYTFLLIQPASGAAGTITLAATAPNAVRSGSLTLSPTNSYCNFLTMKYDADLHLFFALVTEDF